jgi:acyl carrier protein
MTSQLRDADQRRVRHGGAIPFTIEQGMALFDIATAYRDPHAVLLKLDQAALSSQDLPPVLRGVAKVGRRTAASTAAASSAVLVERLRGMRNEERGTAMLRIVQAEAAAVLEHSLEAIAADREFRHLGFDSLTVVELRNRLSGITGLRLPATLVFDYPTPNAVADYLLENLMIAEVPATESALDALRIFESTLWLASMEINDRKEIADRLQKLSVKLLQPVLSTEDGISEKKIKDLSVEMLFDVIDEELDLS